MSEVALLWTISVAYAALMVLEHALDKRDARQTKRRRPS